MATKIYLSIFKGSRTKKPFGSLLLEEFLQGIRLGKWAKAVDHLRNTERETPAYKNQKNALPAVTVSGLYKDRNKLSKPTGLVCLDIDKKDNPKLKELGIVDKECLAQFASCSGEGIKIIYRCEPTTDPAVHRRIFDAAVERLNKKKINIKVDPIVKSIKSLQYVSYDPELYSNLNTTLILKALPPIKRSSLHKGRSQDPEKELAQLTEYVESLGGRDITGSYEDWLTIMFGLSYSFGEQGRKVMHLICKNYPDYNAAECDEKYDACMEGNIAEVSNPVTIASVFSLIYKSMPKVKLKHLNRKYNVVHAVSDPEQATDVEDNNNSDLSGLVRYKLFLFKKIINKKTHVIEELVPTKLNLNAFEGLLKRLGFYRYEDGRIKFVRIVDNIVERMDTADILRIITEYIEKDGDYKFTYREQEYFFSWEEIAHLWREIRGFSSTWNQISAGLQHWVPNLLKDTVDTSYVPYLNGILQVTKADIKLIPYKDARCTDCKVLSLCKKSDCTKPNKEIWKERILQRDFKFTKTQGMFEEFFANTCGRGKTLKERYASSHYTKALWYFGYMLQGTKRRSLARAWLLYDINVGNAGRTGKSIIGEAAGKIRNMVTIDGKRLDLRDKFAFQSVEPWTDIIFIDDPNKYMSIVPLFNMISGNLTAEKKNKDSTVKSVKFMFASNWILEAEGESEIGRQFVTQIDDFYVKFGKSNKDSITPIVDYHGKEFFYGWDEKDWNQFDSFAAKAIQFHLKAEAPANTIIGNSNQIRFIQTHEEEMFFDLCMTFITNAKLGKDGAMLIGQQLMMSVIKEQNENSGGGALRIKAGRIVREFFRAIGVKHIEMSSTMAGNLTQMAYKISQPFKTLDFGVMGDKLPKPRFNQN